MHSDGVFANLFYFYVIASLGALNYFTTVTPPFHLIVEGK